MGLKDVADDAKSSGRKSSNSGSRSSSKTSKSSSGNSTVDNFPKYRRRAPQAVIREDNEGNLESEFYPHTPELTFKKGWYTAPWEPADALPGNWQKIWWDEQSLKHSSHIVEEELGEDFRELLEEDPKSAVGVLNRAARTYNTEKSASEGLSRDCAVCNESIHLLKDDYEEVSNRVVCSSHNARDLASAGLFE